MWVYLRPQTARSEPLPGGMEPCSHFRETALRHFRIICCFSLFPPSALLSFRWWAVPLMFLPFFSCFPSHCLCFQTDFLNVILQIFYLDFQSLFPVFTFPLFTAFSRHVLSCPVVWLPKPHLLSEEIQQTVVGGFLRWDSGFPPRGHCFSAVRFALFPPLVSCPFLWPV